MKIAAFSDVHAHSYSQFSTRLPSGLNSRLVDCLNIVEQVRKYCEAEKIRHVIFGGDMFKSRTKLDVDVFTETFEEFRKLADSVDELYLLCGNHDQFTKIGDINCLTPFRPFCKVIDTHAGYEIAGLKSYFIAHVPDNELLLHYLTLVPYSTDILFMHQAVKEAIPGATDNIGMPKLSVADIDWGRIKMVVSGDIHKRQFLHDGRWYYLGSPLQLTFGEAGQEKGMSVIDTDTLEISHVQLDAPRFYRIDLPDDPAISAEEMDLGGINPDRDFIKLKHTKRCDKVAADFKDLYPRSSVERYLEDIVHVETAMSERLVGNDRALLEEYTKANRIPEIYPDKLLEFGMNELTLSVE